MDKDKQQKLNNDSKNDSKIELAESTPIQSLKPQEKPNNPEPERQNNNQTSEQNNQDNSKKN